MHATRLIFTRNSPNKSPLGSLTGRKFIPASNGNDALCRFVALILILVAKGIIFWATVPLNADPEMMIVGQIMFGVGIAPIVLTTIVCVGCQFVKK